MPEQKSALLPENRNAALPRRLKEKANIHSSFSWYKEAHTWCVYEKAHAVWSFEKTAPFDKLRANGLGFVAG